MPLLLHLLYLSLLGTTIREIYLQISVVVPSPEKVKVGYGLGRDNVNSRPADVFVQGWFEFVYILVLS